MLPSPAPPGRGSPAPSSVTPEVPAGGSRIKKEVPPLPRPAQEVLGTASGPHRKPRLSRPPKQEALPLQVPNRKSRLFLPRQEVPPRRRPPPQEVPSTAVRHFPSPDAWVPPGGGGHFAARLLQESPSPAALGGAWLRKPRLPSRGQGFPTANQRGSESTKTRPLPGGDASKLGKLRPPPPRLKLLPRRKPHPHWGETPPPGETTPPFVRPHPWLGHVPPATSHPPG